MKQMFLTLCAVLALLACQEEDDSASLPQPVELTADSVGFYCQMELLAHEGPKGQIHLVGMPSPLFFSQVKDAIAYLHMPEQNHDVEVVYVQDMVETNDWAAPGDWIAVDEAIYVIGSTRMGGMGAPEFVPFSNEASARVFASAHGGILKRFDEISTDDALRGAVSRAVDGDHSDIANRLRALSPTHQDH